MKVYIKTIGNRVEIELEKYISDTEESSEYNIALKKGLKEISKTKKVVFHRSNNGTLISISVKSADDLNSSYIHRVLNKINHKFAFSGIVIRR